MNYETHHADRRVQGSVDNPVDAVIRGSLSHGVDQEAAHASHPRPNPDRSYTPRPTALPHHPCRQSPCRHPRSAPSMPTTGDGTAAAAPTAVDAAAFRSTAVCTTTDRHGGVVVVTRCDSSCSTSCSCVRHEAAGVGGDRRATRACVSRERRRRGGWACGPE